MSTEYLIRCLDHGGYWPEGGAYSWNLEGLLWVNRHAESLILSTLLADDQPSVVEVSVKIEGTWDESPLVDWLLAHRDCHRQVEDEYGRLIATVKLPG